MRRDWRLNERHYGDLQGKNKAQIKQEFGDEQLHAVAAQLRHPAPAAVPRQPLRRRRPTPATATVDPSDMPRTECLADVVRRTVPYWEAVIVPDLRALAEHGAAVLVAAHGNSIRALRKHLEGISDDEITGLEIPTGIPFRMLLDDDLTVREAEYLGDPEAAAAAAAAVARQADQPTP